MPSRPNFPIPENIHAEPYCLKLMVPDDPTWKRVVAGLLDELNQWYNWQRDEERSGKECAQVWRGLYAQIDWSIMSCCCDQPPVRYRYLEDGTLQSSTDGGVNWENSPNDDIRITTPEFPPIPGDPSDDKTCVAATGMTALIKDQVGDQLTDDMSRYSLDELIRDWTNTYVGTSNPFQAILTIAVNQIFALIIAALRPALTEEVYGALTCIFQENMSDDISFDEEQVESVREDIGDQITGIATLFLQQLVFLLGSGGLTNLARSYGASDGDCDCDDCLCDVSKYEIYPSVEGYFGRIDEIDGCTMDVHTQTQNTNGVWYVLLTTGDYMDGCALESWSVETGVDVNGVLVGQSNTAIYEGAVPGHSYWYITIQANFAFGKSLNFGL